MKYANAIDRLRFWDQASRRAEVPLQAKAVAEIVKKIIDDRSQYLYPTPADISARMGISTQTVQKHLNLLSDHGLITKVPAPYEPKKIVIVPILPEVEVVK